MQKSADAFRTISEVADDLSLPQHVLRFWETRFPQLRPLKRAGGRRYYRPADVSLLKAIRQLLYDDGYTIKGVQRLLKEQGVKGLSAGPPPSDFDWESNVGPHPVADVSNDSADMAVEVREGQLHLGAESLGSGSSLHKHRHTIETALAMVDECKRILDALLTLQR